jgi:hypothetical protein
MYTEKTSDKSKNGTASPQPVMKTHAEKMMHQTTSTMLASVDMFKSWKDPDVQRPLRVNSKVKEMTLQIVADKVIPNTITVGILNKVMYLLDGQHRREAYYTAATMGADEVYCEIRYEWFDTMADMGKRYVELNSVLVKQRPDDILRGMEGSNDALHLIRERCPFVGFDHLRVKSTSPILGMSILLRSWYGSAGDIPGTTKPSAMDIAKMLTVPEASQCCDFANLALRAWGKDDEYKRLWASMTMTMCMWLYRRTVISPDPDTTKITKDAFRLCLTTISAQGDFIDWIRDRKLTERDRGPCYNRIVKLFLTSLRSQGHKRPKLPAPLWAEGKH